MFGLPAIAQTTPSFDCSEAQSRVEDLICADDDLARLDRRLAERYAAAIEAAGRLDAEADVALDNLRATQRGWIKGRNACWTSDDLRACVSTAYLEREGALVAEWLLEAPSATAIWICDGNPDNTLVTLFFDTELPSVRFERDGSVDTGSLVRTASGARYDGGFGRSVWIKGEEATYREPDPEGKEHLCRLLPQDR